MTLSLTPRRIIHHHFADLVARCPHTVAVHLPLVLREDILHAGTEEIANCHLDFFSLYLVQQGRGTHWIDGAPYGVARGDVYAMGLGMTHWFTDCDHLRTHTLHFAPSIFDPAVLTALTETPGFQRLFVEEPLRRRADCGSGGRWLHLTPASYAPVAEMLQELEREWSAGTPDGTLLTRSLFLRLLVHLARRYAETPTRRGEFSACENAVADTGHESTIAVAVRYLDTHFAEPVRIEQVAASVFLSPDRFTEVFAQTMGRTPRDYVRHLRLERARVLLSTTDLPIARIGLESGFGEAAYFTRVFRTALGMTPSDFRRRK